MTRRLRIELDLDAKGFSAKITDAAGKVERFNRATHDTAGSIQRMEQRMRGLMATARDLTLILSQVRVAIYNLRVVMTGWIERVIQANSEVERMTFLLAGMSDGLTVSDRFEEAADNVQLMLNKAKQAPFTIGAMTDSLVKMKAGGLDPLDGSLDSLIDSVAAFGGDDQMLKRASIAIQQMGGKGVVSMEELRQQLGEAVPFAMQLMARSMGLTMKDMVDSISRGEVEAGSALNKMFGEFERTFGGAAARLMNTFSGRISQAKTGLVELSLAIGGFSEGTFVAGGFMDTLNGKLETFIEVLKQPEVEIFAARLGESLVSAVNILEVVVGTLFKMRDVIIAAGKAMVLYFGSTAILGTLAGLSAGFLNAAGSIANFTRATTASNLSLSRFNRKAQIANNIFGMRGRLEIYRRGLIGIGTAFRSLIGPMSVFITTAFFAADALGFFKDKTEEAEKAIKDFNAGMVSEGSLTTMRERIVSISNELEKAEANMDRLQKLAASGRGGNQRSAIDKQREEIIELNRQLNELNNVVSRAEEQLTFENAERAGSQAIRNLQREISELSQTYKKTAQDLATERQAISVDETLSEQQRADATKAVRLREIENVSEHYQKQLSIAKTFQVSIGAQLKAAQSAIAGGGTAEQEQQLRNLRAQYQAVGDFITDLANRATRQTGIFSAAPTLFKDLDGDSDKVDKLANKIVTLQSRLAGLKADFNELTGVTEASRKTLDAFNAELEAGKYTEATAKQVVEARKLATAIDAQAAANKRLKQDQVLQGRIAQQLQRATEYARQMTGVLNGGFNDAQAEAAAYALRLDLIIGKMNNVTRETLQMAEQAKSAFSRGQTAEFLDGLRQQTAEIRINLLERDEQSRATFQRDIDRMWRSVDFTHLTEAEKRRAVDITNSYIEARRAQMEDEMKSQMQRMLEDWQRVTDAMDAAATSWMDSFVDNLVEGKFHFGDFAKSILADIAKIIIRAQLASAILSAIGAVGPSSVTGSTAVTRYTTPTFHSGGIPGQHHKGSKKVLPGLFANAPRFHNGGFPGLKPNEVPAILEKGERVLTKQEQRGQRTGGASVEVNIVNQNGEPMQEKSRSSRFDGEKYIVDVVTEAMNRPGRLRNTTKSLAKS